MKAKLILCVLALIISLSATYSADRLSSQQILPVPADSSMTADAYGYTWVDNDNGGSPVYDWVDITGIGVQVFGLTDDNVVGPFNLEFEFPYYWYTVDQFYIGSNGYISFSSDAIYTQDFPMIPNISQPNNLIIPLAADFDFTSPYGVNLCYYYTNNIDSLVVSWIGVAEWDIPHENTSHTFQLILCAGDSSITFQYGDQVGVFQNPDGACQIGIEDMGGRIGLRYLYNLDPPDRFPHDGLAIRIHADPDPNFEYHDIALIAGMNENSGGVFARIDSGLTLKVMVENQGLVPEDNISVNAEVREYLSEYYDENAVIDHLEPGEIAWCEFPIPFIPSYEAGFTLVFDANLSGDQYGLNDTDTIEVRSYNLPAILGYVNNISYRPADPGQNGWANEFEISEPIVITNITANLKATYSMLCDFSILLSDENGYPDEENLLWFGDQNINDPSGSWHSIPVVPPLSILADEKFFVVVEANGYLRQGYEDTLLTSRRSWERTDSFAPYRYRDDYDFAINVICDPVPEPCDYVPGDFNGDGLVIGSDVTFGVNYFRGISDPPPDSCYNDWLDIWHYSAADANGDCSLIGSDITFMVNYFRGVQPEILWCRQTPPSGE
ncbi:MAG: hypothetical protein GY839_08455 [candidate division Zixibacteria bacterium]|nr:hypothetical protein [candidate division Zixibacteria bacterium]